MAKLTKQKVNLKLIFILIIAALLSITVTQFFYNYYRYSNIKQVQVFEMKMAIDDFIGVDLENQSLNFGVVIPGNGAKRYIEISSEEPVLVVIALKGELAPLVSVSENNFVFEGRKSLTFTAVAPSDAEKREYKGKAILLFKKV